MSGTDFGRGISLASLKDHSLLLGHANGEPVILVRQGDVVHAIGAICTHYGAPLADGLLVGD
ncbi:MAG: Rieske 2Fe-2S domain-containing protein, partial [Casimicrobiaceae bacterium]